MSENTVSNESNDQMTAEPLRPRANSFGAIYGANSIGTMDRYGAIYASQTPHVNEEVEHYTARESVRQAYQQQVASNHSASILAEAIRSYTSKKSTVSHRYNVGSGYFDQRGNCIGVVKEVKEVDGKEHVLVELQPCIKAYGVTLKFQLKEAPMVVREDF